MRLASTPHEALAFLEQAERIRVRQRVEPVEVLVGLQMRNRYEIHDAEDRLRLVVRERGGLGRWFLRQALEWLRPFQMEIRDPDERLVLHLRRPFRFFFHRLEVRDAQGRLLGVVRRRISWIRRVYAIDDAQGTMQAELVGPLLRPWTFETASAAAWWASSARGGRAWPRSSSPRRTTSSSNSAPASPRGCDCSVSARPSYSSSSTSRPGPGCSATSEANREGVRGDALFCDGFVAQRRRGERRQISRIQASTSRDSLGMSRVRTRQPRSVTSTSSSMRTPMPRYFAGTVKSSTWK